MTLKIIRQTSFASGEISPELYGRSDTAEYSNGIETGTNCIVTPRGPIKRRNGTQFIAEVKDSSTAKRLIRYQFSQDTAFILELGNQYIRFYRDTGQVLESTLNITNITQASPGVVTSNAHGLANGDHVYITGVTGMTEVNSSTVAYTVANVTTNTFELQGTDTSAYTAYSSGGEINRVYEISSPYTTAQIPNVQYAQSGSTLYLVHPEVAPYTLVRTSDTSWALNEMELSPPPTYESGYDYNLAVKPLATTGVDINVIVGAVDLTDGVTYRWTASGSGTDEYYLELIAGGDPSVDTPLAVSLNDTLSTEGTVGSLAAGEYDYGDNDTLGYDTIYVRLSDGTDPDSKSAGYVVYSESDIFLQGDVGRQIINLSSGETGRTSVTSVTNGAIALTDIVEDFTNTDIIAAGDSKLDLSPVVDLEFDSSQGGSVVNIRPEYTAGSTGPRYNITNVTSANPAVVTTSTAHGYSDGDKVQIQDIEGMTQINDKQFTIDNVTSTTFELKGENSTGYTTYSSGGIVRRVLSDIKVDAFRSADVGKYILANGGVMEIITVNSASDIDAIILKSLNDSEETGNWTLETPTWTSSRGYPRAVGLYEERLIFGGTSARPQTIWMSETGIFEGFGAGPDDEDSIVIPLVSNEVNEVNWISSGRDLVVGTSGGELTVSSGGSSAITPSSKRQQPRTYHGSKTQQVVNVKDEILFIQGSGRKVRTFRYDFNIDGYTGEDLTFLAEHITEQGISELAYAQEPDTIIYAVSDDGRMLTGTYDRSKKVIGWTTFETDGYYENVQTITNAAEDAVFTVVRRTINGTTKRYIERFDSGSGTDDADGFSDSYLTLSEGKTVSNITQASPAVVTSTGHGLSNGDTVIIKDLVDPLGASLDASKTNMTDLNQKTFTVANAATNTFELSGLDTSNYNPYSSGGTAYKKVSTISGLDHLEGKTVQIKVDGATHADKAVSDGALSLDTSAGEVVIGLPYTTTIKTLNNDFDIGLGSMQGQRARWARPLLRVYKSTAPIVDGEYIPTREGSDLMDQKVPLKSGFLEYGGLKYANTTAITITTSDPLPLVLTGITGTIVGSVK